MLPREEVEFQTIDGLTLKATLYIAANKNPGPGIVMAPGFNCTKDMFIPEAASSFQTMGITALAYDPRSIGSSGGFPRNDIDPPSQVSDYSDALTYLISRPEVDDSQVVIWGFSFSGAVALCAAAMDPRPVCTIAVCPLVDFTCRKLPEVLQLCAQDRESQIVEGNPAFSIPLLTEAGENPAGFGVGLAKENYEQLYYAKQTIAPTFENQTTVQSYYKVAMWQPFGVWQLLKDMPVLWIVPEKDELSPAQEQIRLYNDLSTRKKLYVVPDKGHMDVLSGEGHLKAMKVQTDFIAKMITNHQSNRDEW